MSVNWERASMRGVVAAWLRLSLKRPEKAISLLAVRREENLLRLTLMMPVWERLFWGLVSFSLLSIPSMSAFLAILPLIISDLLLPFLVMVRFWLDLMKEGKVLKKR